MDLTFYQILWIFVIYAFIGWCTEVVYAAVDSGKYVNRGFLSGPVCPIYGFGVLFVVLALTPLKDRLILLFLCSVLLTSLLEFVTGFLLEKFFNDKWWDYSDEPFNIKGYVCLKFSLMWGVACVIVMAVVHPLVMRFIDILPETVGIILLTFFLIVFSIDVTLTLLSVLHLKKRLRVLSKIADQLTRFSVFLGEPLSGGALDLKVKLDEGKENLKELKVKGKVDFVDLKTKSKAELSSLKIRNKEQRDEFQLKYKEDLDELKMKLKYKRLYWLYRYNQNRILKSFPRLQTGRHKDNLEWLKQLFEGWLK